ncbi:hypothetical protein [Gordonia paraffinivorans]|uniref:hypothetical protein n=1 Tax=Gordonia paraffinivorans TaxID=175628 RepID=UPI003FCE42E6
MLESPAIQVDTCHGPVYVQIGQNSRGQLRVVVVVEGDEYSDIHLTDMQASQLAMALDDQANRLYRAFRPHLCGGEAS